MTRIEGITLAEWDDRYDQLSLGRDLKSLPYGYGGPLGRHVDDGDTRLLKLRFDPSPAALRLWNFLLTEESRLHQARSDGKKIVGTMKDLGTVPVMAYSLPNAVAFYPDGAWWTPCIMEANTRLLAIADSLGVDESLCPVRAMLGAFLTQDHFPIPDMLTCSVGATCDDFSAIAQRLEGLGYPILWWEIPSRRNPDPDEPSVTLPGGFQAPKTQVDFVLSEFERIRSALSRLAGIELTDQMLSEGIRMANKVRRILAELRRLAYTAPVCPMPALEMQIAEMMAIHFCSDREECLIVLQELLDEVRERVRAGTGVLSQDAARVFWVNPVADIRMMNLLEQCGGRICGAEYLFCHALDAIPQLDGEGFAIPPLEALAQMALADPMVGSAMDRAERICRDIREFGAEAIVVSRIPGASHCGTEGSIILDIVANELGIPGVEIEVPPICDAMEPTLTTRITALVETVVQRRHMSS